MPKTIITDNMIVEIDVPIGMDDGAALRADIFRLRAEGKYPVMLSYRPYRKNLHFSRGYPDQWSVLAEKHKGHLKEHLGSI